MKKILFAFLAIILMGCTKGFTDLIGNPNETSRNGNIANVLIQRAENYAYNKWSASTTVKADTFYFETYEFSYEPDSLNYKTKVLDSKAVAAFRYIFEPVKATPGLWDYMFFVFKVDFEYNGKLSSIIYKYPLSQSMFRFL